MPKCYGRLPSKIDDSTPQLRKYLAASPQQLAIPPAISWFQAIARDGWPMLDNDRIGDCTAAAAGHLIQSFSANAGALITPTDDQVLKVYVDTTGYDPQTGANDNGCPETRCSITGKPSELRTIRLTAGLLSIPRISITYVLALDFWRSLSRPESDACRRAAV